MIHTGYIVILLLVLVVGVVAYLIVNSTPATPATPDTVSSTASSAPSSSISQCNAVHVWPVTNAGGVATFECGLFGPSYTGGQATRVCDAQGNWQEIDFTKCIKTGIDEKIDISGQWKYNIAGNDFGTVTVQFDTTTNSGTISNFTLPAGFSQEWVQRSGYDIIKYKPGTGYVIGENPPMAFTDKSKTVLTNGAVVLSK